MRDVSNNKQKKLKTMKKVLIQTQVKEIEKKETKLQQVEINYERELIKFQKEVLGFEKVIDTKNRKIELLEAELKRIKEGKGEELPTSEAVESS